MWTRIEIVHRSMENDLWMADELYIKRGYLALADLHIISLYSLCCIANQKMNLENNFNLLVLFFNMHFAVQLIHSVTFLFPLSPASHPAYCSQSIYNYTVLKHCMYSLQSNCILYSWDKIYALLLHQSLYNLVIIFFIMTSYILCFFSTSIVFKLHTEVWKGYIPLLSTTSS